MRVVMLRLLVLCMVLPCGADAQGLARPSQRTSGLIRSPALPSANSAETGPLPPSKASHVSAQPILVTLQAGQTQVLRVPGVVRVVVGNGEAIQAVVLERREVVVFARSRGQSSLHVWRADGVRDDYEVTVDAAGTQQMQGELQALLKGIPRATSVVVGDKIVIEGHDLSDGDRARVAALAQRYPQLVDFTSAVGWDSMVMLDVKVVEIPRHHLRALGIRWDAGSQGGINAGISWDAVGGAALSERAGDSPLPRGAANAPFAGYLGTNMLWTSRVDALSESGEAVILAQPQLLARSGATADFLAGGEVPYATVDSNGKTNTVFKPYGVSIEMTPRVERNGIVRSRIVVEASAVDSSVAGTGGPALKTRRASTEFNVRSGRTLVLAGFLSHERSASHSGIPGLRDLPLIGGLFGTRQTIRRDTELAIFVTPTIVSEDHPALRERAFRAETIIDQSRAQAPRLNVPVHHIDVRHQSFDAYDLDVDIDTDNATNTDTSTSTSTSADTSTDTSTDTDTDTDTSTSTYVDAATGIYTSGACATQWDACEDGPFHD